MAERTRYLLTYDIRDPRRLRRVHQAAKDYGYPLQFSVFVCDLSAVELIGLRARMLDEVNTKVDSVALFDLGPPRGRGAECVSYLGQRPSVPSSDEPTIW